MSIFGAKCPPPLAKHNNTKLIFFFSIAGKTDVRTANFRTAFRRATRRSIVITCTVVDGVWGSGVCGDVDDVVLWLTMVSKFVGTPVTNVLSRLASTSKINTLSLATCPALSHSLSHTHSLSQNWTENSLASTLSIFLWTYRTHTHTAYVQKKVYIRFSFPSALVWIKACTRLS